MDRSMKSFLTWLASERGGPEDVNACVSFDRSDTRTSAKIWSFILQECMIRYLCEWASKNEMAVFYTDSYAGY